MSLTDKIVKNTFYQIISQGIGFLFPLILIPLIISHIGQVEFGIYALVLGLIGTFGLFDLSLSTSFIKFISEHYNRREFEELNNTINTGFVFYVSFSLAVSLVVYALSGTIITVINVPQELVDTGVFALKIGIAIFFLATSTTIFVSILVSLQKMYVNSLLGLVINFLNFCLTIVLLELGMGLKGVLLSQLGTVLVSVLCNILLAKRALPELRFSIRSLNSRSFKKMFNIGLQMQVSKISAFISEKYDEFLLSYFSVLNNVTFFNLASKVTRFGKFFPIQLFQQAAPAAAELDARNEQDKLHQLFIDTTKYLSLASLPIFLYMFTFAELIVFTWVGDGYALSAYLLRILVIGQVLNLMISAPGNSIIPNIGIPKYLMYEGIIALVINLVISFFLIKHYGIWGAAIGNSIATVISSIYLFSTSIRFFRERKLVFILKNYTKPLLVCVAISAASYFLYRIALAQISGVNSRLGGIVYIILTGILFTLSYIFVIYKTGYLTKRDKQNISKLKNYLFFRSKSKSI